MGEHDESQPENAGAYAAPEDHPDPVVRLGVKAARAEVAAMAEEPDTTKPRTILGVVCEPDGSTEMPGWHARIGVGTSYRGIRCWLYQGRWLLQVEGWSAHEATIAEAEASIRPQLAADLEALGTTEAARRSGYETALSDVLGRLDAEGVEADEPTLDTVTHVAAELAKARATVTRQASEIRDLAQAVRDRGARQDRTLEPSEVAEVARAGADCYERGYAAGFATGLAMQAGKT